MIMDNLELIGLKNSTQIMRGAAELENHSVGLFTFVCTVVYYYIKTPVKISPCWTTYKSQTPTSHVQTAKYKEIVHCEKP
jgi:hypothetical protein